MTGQGKSGLTLPPVYQLGFVVSDIEKACEYYTSKFGIGPFSPFDVDMDGVIFRGKPISTKIKVAMAKSGEIEIEFIQPVEGENVYTEFLAGKGDGIHHLGYQVENMDVMLADFASKGLHPVFHKDMDVMRFAYFDTSEVGGLMTEFLCWKK